MKVMLAIVVYVFACLFPHGIAGAGKEGGGAAAEFAWAEPMSGAGVTLVSMDFDGNGRVNVTDVQGMIDWLYLGGTPASCPPVMDYDANGQVNVTDLLGLMEWLYLGGQAPFYPGKVTVKGGKEP